MTGGPVSRQVMDASRLRIERERITLSRVLAAEAERCLLAHNALHDVGAPGDYIKVMVRCDQAHSGGRVPKLAEVHATRRGLLFASKIAWLPRDQLVLQPWLRQHLEGAGMAEATYLTCMQDDDALADLLDRHDEWARGLPASGPRWLISTPPHLTLAVVRPGAAASAIGLWVRCKDHPEHAEALDSASLFAATR